MGFWKKLKNTVGDIGKTMINSATTPLRAVGIVKKLPFGMNNFANQKLARINQKVFKAAVGVQRGALAVGGAILGAKALKGGSGVKNTLTDTNDNPMLKNLFGNAGGGLKDILSGLPSLSDILQGGLSGVKDTVSNSPAGQQVKEDAAKDWFQENWKTGALILSGFLVTILTVLNLRK